MALTKYQQFTHLITQSERVLILVSENPDGDALGAAFGMAHCLDALGIVPTVAFSDPQQSGAMYSFLPQPENIRHSLSGVRDLILSFNTTHNDITNVTTERDGDMLNVRVTPERGMIDTRDFSFKLAAFPYDVMVLIGTATKESVGALYAEMPDIFYDVPMINIDNKTANENFGQLNIVTLTASSLSEVVIDLCKSLGDKTISPRAANCFLAGIISATDSFRAPRTTPAALSLSGEMIDHGADQQEIITHLYKSQPLGLLKLWGRTMRKLQKDESDTIITATLTTKDFLETGTAPHYLSTILGKIKQNHAHGKIFVIIYEDHDKIKALIDATRHGEIPEELTSPDGEEYIHNVIVDAPDTETARTHIVNVLRSTQENEK